MMMALNLQFNSQQFSRRFTELSLAKEKEEKESSMLSIHVFAKYAIEVEHGTRGGHFDGIERRSVTSAKE